MSRNTRMCDRCFCVYDQKLSACHSCADRELLELAAKAAGITLDGEGDRVDVRTDGGAPMTWNPLTDDGDALRLAKTLELILAFRPWAVCIWKGRKQYSSYGGEASLEMHHVRNAIVNAAAEIGRAMP